MLHTFIYSKCPHCGKKIEFRETHEKYISKIGEGYFSTCVNCGGIYHNGKKEWPELTKEEQSEEIRNMVFSNLGTGLSFGIIIIVIVLLIVFFVPEIHIKIVLIIIGAILIYLLINILVGSSKRIISDSIDRYNKKLEK